MNFDEWLENYYSGTQIDDITASRMQTAFEAGIADQGLKQEWQPIETAPRGKALLVFYKNRLGKDRIIKAKYIEKHTEEACEDAISAEFFDYCEEKDEYFTPEGWFEIIDNGHEYSSYALETGNNPTHWQPLPEPPTNLGVKI